MVEIELKAWVRDIPSFFSKVSSFAEFQRACYKKDTYWKDCGREIQIRLREEETFFTDFSQLPIQKWPVKQVQFEKESWLYLKKNGEKKTDLSKTLVTYKRKELLESSFEVNQEQEFQIDKKEALEVFLQDAGFSISLKKEKLVAAWEWEDVNLELCFIPELGNFLELEVLSPSDSSQVVTATHKKLRTVLGRCGIDESAIEGRYYSQLLQEVRKSGNN